MTRESGSNRYTRQHKTDAILEWGLKPAHARFANEYSGAGREDLRLRVLRRGSVGGSEAEVLSFRLVRDELRDNDGAEDVIYFRRACLDGNLTPAKSLLLRFTMSVARTVCHPADNSKLAKASKGKRLGACDAAAILAVSSKTREALKPSRRIYYGMVGKNIPIERV